MSDPIKPTAEHYAQLTQMNPKLAYTPAQKGLAVLLACEAYSPALLPWKLNALRVVLKTQQDVEDLQAKLKALAAEQALTTLSDSELQAQLLAQCVNTPNAADWVLAQQQAMPVKNIARTILLARNYMAQMVAKDDLDQLAPLQEQDAPQLSTVLLLPKCWQEIRGEGQVCRPSLSLFHAEPLGSVDYTSRAGWLIHHNAGQLVTSYDSGAVELYQEVPQEAAPVALTEGSTTPATPAPPSAPLAAQPATLDLLKASILTMIKQEVNGLLSAETIAGLVAKQVAGNPLLIQQALVKVFSVATNPTSAAVFSAAANEAVQSFLTTQGKDYFQTLVNTWLSKNLNAGKIETEAIKQLNANVDNYFAQIFTRVVVKDGADNIVGHLGFKDTTTLTIPMPKHPLASKLAATDSKEDINDMPF